MTQHLKDRLPFHRYLDRACYFITNFNLSQWLIVDADSALDALHCVDKAVLPMSVQAASIFKVKRSSVNE
jgi:hypothetical protein